MKDISKKKGVILLLAAIFLVILMTFYILNYGQVQKVAEGPKESDSGGEVSLTIVKPPEIGNEGGDTSPETIP